MSHSTPDSMTALAGSVRVFCVGPRRFCICVYAHTDTRRTAAAAAAAQVATGEALFHVKATPPAAASPLTLGQHPHSTEQLGVSANTEGTRVDIHVPQERSCPRRPAEPLGPAACCRCRLWWLVTAGPVHWCDGSGHLRAVLTQLCLSHFVVCAIVTLKQGCRQQWSLLCLSHRRMWCCSAFVATCHGYIISFS